MQHVYLGNLEKAILSDLALHPNSLIKPIKERLKKDYKNVHNAIKTLIAKECVVEGEEVLTKKGAKYPGYKLTDLGILYVFLSNNIDYDKVERNYPTDSFIIEYRKILKTVPNKSLVKKLLRKAAQLALDQDDQKAVNLNPNALLSMSFDSVRFYSKLPSDEKECIEQLSNKLMQTMRGNRRLRRAYKEIGKAMKERVETMNEKKLS